MGYPTVCWSVIRDGRRQSREDVYEIGGFPDNWRLCGYYPEDHRARCSISHEAELVHLASQSVE